MLVSMKIINLYIISKLLFLQDTQEKIQDYLKEANKSFLKSSGGYNCFAPPDTSNNVFAVAISQSLFCLRNPEISLLNHLLQDNRADALPRTSVDTPVLLKYQIAIRQILDVDERSQVLSTNVWIRQYWNDPYLKWNVTEWSNISFLSVLPDTIWIPDISLYNNANDGFQGLQDYGKTNINVYPNGDCVWLLPIILKSECKMSMEYFPFDTQKCPLEFGSWVFDGAALDLQIRGNGIDMSAFSENGEFTVIGGEVKRVVVKYGCCPNPYITLNHEIILERRVQFYLFNLLIPGIIIAILACFTFLLPPGSGERTGLIITNLLALSVYVLMVSDQIPPSAESVPLLVKFYTTLVSEIAVALMINCIIIPIDIWNTPMPNIIKKIFIDILGPLVFCYVKCKSDCTKDSEQIQLNEMVERNLNKQDVNNELEKIRDRKTSSNYEAYVMKHLKMITDVLLDDKATASNNDDWTLLTKILDRIFFFVFFFIIITSAIILILARSP